MARAHTPQPAAQQAGAPSAGAPALERRIGISGALVIGLASMVGAGLFAAFAPVAEAAGGALLVGLAIALVAASCNALATAQLAAQYPSSGGSYLYGRERLGEWAGFTAGWGFVIGKTASAAAMALTAAAYLAPEGWMKPAAIVAIVLLVGANLLGITRTTAIAAAIVATVLGLLAVLLVVAWTGSGADFGATLADLPDRIALDFTAGHGVLGILQSAGLLFFAFAGYARIATLGEEVRDPERNIPRAIVITLTLVAMIYIVVAITLIAVLGPEILAASDAPIALAVANIPWAVPLAAIAAGLASLGALLAGLAGITRTALAMSRNKDLPGVFGHINTRSSVPDYSLLLVGLAAIVLIVLGDIRTVIGFSSVGVLAYYLIANLAALSQDEAHRFVPKWLQWIGAALCTILIVTLPWQSIAAGVFVLAVGLLGRVMVLQHR